ncbi:MAG: type I DNA topoisomerase [Alphaproteobacteria bacterium]
MKNLVIVESPAKCKTINKYLGKDYSVLASFGHIRDLPSKNNSVRPEEDFALTYEVDEGSERHIKEIIKNAKEAERIILATDPDREGEAISWHVLEVLKQRKAIKKDTKIERISFNSITKDAVLEAMKKPRDIDMDLVNAQQARRALDYLVGFRISPILWRKLPGSKSAGRVQSVALRIVCEREREIENFIPQEYWDLFADFKLTKDTINGELITFNGEKVDKFYINNKEKADGVLAEVKKHPYKIAEIEHKQSKRNPYAPFNTSGLQQDASAKLGFSASKTMMVAQKLYEGVAINKETTGLITYMRTDAVDIIPAEIQNIRGYIAEKFDRKYLSETINIYKSKAKNAQEAHEAVRPTSIYRSPDSVRAFLSDDEFKLYKLIWSRTLASQMSAMQYDKENIFVESDNKKITFKVSGSVMKFDGFSKVYEIDTGDDRILPKLTEGEKATIVVNDNSPKALQHFTEHPPRYNEASLVKKLEELGIGRPSTYATILHVIQSRQYVRLEEKRFVPEIRGRLVNAFLEHYFTQYVQYDFTAKMEEDLDEISDGKINWKKFLKEFWEHFAVVVESASKLDYTAVTASLEKDLEYLLFAKEDRKVDKTCPICKTGTLELKMGKFGAFLGCGNYPTCQHTEQIVQGDEREELVESTHHYKADEPNIIGKDESGETIYLIRGPFGWYLQLGEVKEGGKKPKRHSLSKDINFDDVNLENAIKLLSYPKVIGTYPETKTEVLVNIGRFGPYLQYEDGAKKKIFVSIKKPDEPATIGINRAIDLITEHNNKPKDGKKRFFRKKGKK